MRKGLAIVLLLIGIWFLASAATPNGLLPGGHGLGRGAEIVVGLILVAYGIFRLRPLRK